MNMLIIFLSISILISSIMLIIPSIIAPSTQYSSQKNSSFECGMNLLSMPRNPFSLRFFLLMVLFIIFDVEIALILAMPLFILQWSYLVLMVSIFFIILLMGTLYEWKEGSLQWLN